MSLNFFNVSGRTIAIDGSGSRFGRGTSEFPSVKTRSWSGNYQLTVVQWSISPNFVRHAKRHWGTAFGGKFAIYFHQQCTCTQFVQESLIDSCIIVTKKVLTAKESFLACAHAKFAYICWWNWPQISLVRIFFVSSRCKKKIECRSCLFQFVLFGWT